MDNKPLHRSQQLVGDDERADGVIARTPAGVADHMRVPLRQAGVFGRIQSGVHARENRKSPRRRQCKLPFLAKGCHVLGIGRHDFIENITSHLLLPQALRRVSARENNQYHIPTQGRRRPRGRPDPRHFNEVLQTKAAAAECADD